jgi:hypothetical protein
MDKERLFHWLREQDRETLLGLLFTAYDFLGHDDRKAVFGVHDRQVTQDRQMAPAQVDGERLLADIRQFATRSREGHYYAPFRVDSKNFMDVPEETAAWFEKMGALLQASGQLTAQQQYQHAVACFGLLYELIDEMERGDEIVFGDEIGSWMIPGDEKQYLTAYMAAVAQTATPDAFAEIVIPLARRDSRHSLAGAVYATACRLANAAQRKKLDAEIQRHNIRTERWW